MASGNLKKKLHLQLHPRFISLIEKLNKVLSLPAFCLDSSEQQLILDIEEQVNILHSNYNRKHKSFNWPEKYRKRYGIVDLDTDPSYNPRRESNSDFNSDSDCY